MDMGVVHFFFFLRQVQRQFHKIKNDVLQLSLALQEVLSLEHVIQRYIKLFKKQEVVKELIEIQMKNAKYSLIFY